MSAAAVVDRDAVWEALATVPDPEIPTLSIVDLGIVREVAYTPQKGWLVTITPTYSGCPAMEVIEHDIGARLRAGGFMPYRIETSIAPAWTTAWMTEAGRAALASAGIAPPRDGARAQSVDISALSKQPDPVTCPRCGSRHTRVLAAFGSTACKALYRCDDCLEPFDHFKEH